MCPPTERDNDGSFPELNMILAATLGCEPWILVMNCWAHIVTHRYVIPLSAVKVENVESRLKSIDLYVRLDTTSV
jgi:hypothetical protein